MTTVNLERRRIYGAYSTGVTALAGLVDGEPAGIAASSFIPVSLEPALVSVCVAHTSSTWPQLRQLSHIGISVMAAEQEWLSRQLAGRSDDRFAGVQWRASAEGAVFLEGAAAWFDCTIEQQVRAGDHDIVVLAVHDLDALHHSPLVFHASDYRQLT